MNPNNPLDQLKDIHLPGTISAWPPAYGWWICTILVIIGLTLLTRWFLSNRKKKRYKVEANALLLEIQQQHQSHQDSLKTLEAINSLLKQTCMTRYGRNEAAGLTGEAWLNFLDTTLDPSGDTKDFTKGPGRCLIYTLYAPNPVAPIEELVELTKKWIAKQS